MFQAERVDNVYMLRNSEVTVGGLQLSSTSKAVVVELLETTMDSSFDVQLYPKGRLGLARNKVVQIVTPIVEQILINLCRSRRSLGNKVQVGPELI